MLAGHKPQSNYPEGRRGLRILNMTTDSLQVRLSVQLHVIVILIDCTVTAGLWLQQRGSFIGWPPLFPSPHYPHLCLSALTALTHPPSAPHCSRCRSPPPLSLTIPPPFVPPPPPPVVLQDMSQLQYGHWLATATQLPNGMISVMSDSPAPVGPANLGPTSLGAIVKVGAAAFPSLPYTPPPPA